MLHRYFRGSNAKSIMFITLIYVNRYHLSKLILCWTKLYMLTEATILEWKIVNLQIKS